MHAIETKTENSLDQREYKVKSTIFVELWNWKICWGKEQSFQQVAKFWNNSNYTNIT